MLDRLHLFLPFKQEACKYYFWTTEKRHGKSYDVLKSSVDLAKLGVPMQAGSVSLDAKERYVVSELRHPWDNLPSSYTPLAFKVFHEGFGFRGEAGIELKASPAKLLQGHNLFGPTSIRDGAMAMLSWLVIAHPGLLDKLNLEDAQVCALDCTFSARLPSERTAQQVIDALRGISNGQTKSRGDNYKETAYWGAKKTRLKKLKAYLKQYEYAEQLKEVERLAGDYSDKANAARRTFEVMSDPRLVEWSKCLLRFEATAQSRWLFRRGISSNLKKLCEHQERLELEGRCLIREVWQEIVNPIFKACEGMDMKTIDDEKVQAVLREKLVRFNKYDKPSYCYANNVFNTFRDIRNYGWEEVRQSKSKNIFYKHIRDLTSCGISKAALQKLRDIQKNNVVPLLRFVEVDFSAQRPDWYVEPKIESVIDAFDRDRERQAANDVFLQYNAN